MAKAIEEIKCTSAENFLKVLHRSNPLWNDARQFWAFRGHDDDSNELIPAALRDKKTPAQLGYTSDPKIGIQKTNQKQIDAEFHRIHEFYWAVDAQGLNVPGDSNLMRTPAGWEELTTMINDQGWPIDPLLPLLALAQHYGVPTRLLDWSGRPLVAAYFAAKKPKNGSSRKLLSVWALNLDWVINKAFPSKKTKIPVYIVTAPRASNPYLHAQGGIFTTDKLNKGELRKRVTVQPVNDIVEKRWKELKWSRPVMAHITLPAKEAGKLLRLLNQEGINAATLYPGYQGAADSLKERVYWDNPKERASYWMK